MNDLVVNLLVVEDDEPQLANWVAQIEYCNADSEANGYIIDLTQTKTLSGASELLKHRSFDIAVIDVRLEPEEGKGPNSDGNIVLDMIVESELTVVALYTGETALASTPDWNNAVQIFQKGSGLEDILLWIKSQIPMIRQIKSVQIDIKKQMAQLFNRSIWPRWSRWLESQQSDGTDQGKFIESSLKRHLTSHIYATYLEQANQKVHPEEWYFMPPVRDGLRTGDIIKNGDVVEVLITPRCDLARDGKNETLQLALCKSVNEKWTTLCTDVTNAKAALEGNQDPNRITKLTRAVDDSKGRLRKFSQHSNNSNVFHFLPEINIDENTKIGPFLVQFDKIRYVQRSDTEARQALESMRIASITPDFLPSLVERLGAYFSRIGTPDYSHPD